MTGKTHRLGGVLCCLAGYSFLEQNNMLLSDVSPILQLTVMYPFAIYGSVFSDLDHHWESTPVKEPISLCVNKILHLTTGLRKKGVKLPLLGIFDAKHRSWQTHSDILFILCCYFLYRIIGTGVSSADEVILKLILTGFLLGLVSHLVLDMLTPEGISCTISKALNKLFGLKLSESIRFVPKTRFFATGGKWECVARQVLWLMSFLFLLRFIYSISPYTIHFNL